MSSSSKRVVHMQMVGALIAASCSCACNSNAYAGPVPRTIEAFVPPGSETHGEYFKEFEVDGEIVRLTYVEYGLLLDCPSGCFSSGLCAIETEDEVLLYYAGWNEHIVDEKPRELEEHCAGDTTGYTETYGSCEAEGKSHPLPATEEFRAFAEEQYGSGPFRFCVRYLASDCLASPCP